MPDIRLVLAIAAGRLTHGVLRRLSLGGGTAAPGLVAAAVDPTITTKLAASLPHGSVIVTGTNGKTTTTRLLADVLRRAGMTPIHNRSGSNMMRGIASALAAAADWRGWLPADIGLWEVDEATLPDAIGALHPRLVVINNLFRDQLDRYGEVNTVAAIWAKALAQLSADSIVVLNADDPRVAHLGRDLRQRVVYFGIEDASCALPALPEAADSIHCLDCRHSLIYDAVYSSHMGRYRCPSCGLIRPAPQVSLQSLRMIEGEASTLVMAAPNGNFALRLAMPGLYNAYNALAAATAALALDIAPAIISDAVAHFRAAFGRVERMPAGDKEIALFLVKNPAGFNEVLRTVFSGDSQRNVLIVINDLLADGTDVSWLWDVDFETMAGKVARATVSGIRAADMALRLRYAEALPALSALTVEADIAGALGQALDATPPGETLYVLPTYTAMLDVKNELTRRGLAPRWQDD
jgi:UDP-N-acetylmuramyl tripeptide synthase